MKRYFCNGKKGYCDRGNDENIDCKDCEFANGTGGEVVDAPNTNYERIKNMSVEELAEFMQYCGWDYPPYCGYRKIQECDQNCIKCTKQWLESEVEG